MNVLSLFDGMSCGRIALDKANIKVNNYFRSEIDPYATKVAESRWDDVVSLGDVRDVTVHHIYNLAGKPKVATPKGRFTIDLLIGGSPCQGFSFAQGSNRPDFDDPRSALFWEYKRLLDELKPKYFLLENVRMSQKCQDVISEALGVQPVEINSSLVSAQNRRRLYWTNIPFTTPDDKGLVIKDILDDYSAPLADYKPVPINERNARHYREVTQKALCCTASMYKGAGNNGCTLIGMADDINGHDILKRVYAQEGKAPTLNTMQGGNRQPKTAIDTDKKVWRKLSVTECERLQTVPVGYTEGVSNTQRYKMLGNGWTVDVVAEIFKGIEI